jgi:hypothetical protein
VPSVVRAIAYLLNTILNAGQPKRHFLTTGWSVFVSAKRLVAGDSVLFIWYVHTSGVPNNHLFSPFFPLLPIRYSFFLLILCLVALSGMTITSFCWEFVGQIGHKQSCHLQSYQVIACISVFLLQLLMLLRQIAGLQFSTTQGRTSIITFFFWRFSCQMF